jgi:hypothetical protein
MAVMAMCTSDTSLDVGKCVMLAIVHDLAEAQGAEHGTCTGMIVIHLFSQSETLPQERVFLRLKSNA